MDATTESAEIHQDFIRLQGFIRLTACLGLGTSIRIMDFLAQYPTTQHSIAHLSQALSFTATNLLSLSSTISKPGPEIYSEQPLTEPLVATIHAILEKVDRALEEGLEAEKNYGNEWEDLERVDGRAKARARQPSAYSHAGCVRFSRVLGGYEATDELVWYLEALKEHVFFLTKAMQYLALKKKESE